MTALEMLEADVDTLDLDDFEFLRFLLVETRALLLPLAERDLLEVRCDLEADDEDEVLGCCMVLDFDSEVCF